MRPSGRFPASEAPGELSGLGGGGTPGPIPNPEVKPSIAEGTAVQSVGEQDAAEPARGLLGVGGGSFVSHAFDAWLFFLVDKY